MLTERVLKSMYSRVKMRDTWVDCPRSKRGEEEEKTEEGSSCLGVCFNFNHTEMIYLAHRPCDIKIFHQLSQSFVEQV